MIVRVNIKILKTQYKREKFYEMYEQILNIAAETQRKRGEEMCWVGEPGEKGYNMTTKEAMANMARLSLMGKLSLAILECNPWWHMVPYYDWNPKIKKEELLHQICAQSFASQYDTLSERVLSILLRNLEEKALNPERLKAV